MIPYRVSISQRPLEAYKRSVVGHWEVDTIVSGKKTKSKAALCVCVDRMSNYAKVVPIPNLKPDSMNQALIRALGDLPCHTITYDNGIENKGHMAIKRILNCLTFCCHPYCSWEKPIVENVNGRIRRFIAK